MSGAALVLVTLVPVLEPEVNTHSRQLHRFQFHMFHMFHECSMMFHGSVCSFMQFL